MPKKNLSPKQMSFIEEFIVDLDVENAALRAGYNEKKAKSAGRSNITKPEIQKAIMETYQKRQRNGSQGFAMTEKERKYEEAVSAIMTTPHLQDATRMLGIDYSTLWRWLQDPDLQELLSLTRQCLMEGTISSLQSAMSEAIGTLRDLASDKNTPPASRVSAAKTIIDMAFKGWAVIDTEKRIREIEEKMSLR
jgi:Terminase small subunit